MYLVAHGYVRFSPRTYILHSYHLHRHADCVEQRHSFARHSEGHATAKGTHEKRRVTDIEQAVVTDSM